MKLTRLACLFILATTLISPAAFAATTTWQGGGTGLWSEAGNWTGGLPQAGDTVIFNDTTSTDDCTIDSDVNVDYLNITSYSGTLTFLQDADANISVTSDLFLDTDATIVCTYSSLTNNIDGIVTNGTGRLISVDGNATILGVIDAKGQGFPRNSGPGTSTSTHHGASYGGYGALAGPIYGSLTQPTSLGSGGSGIPAPGGGAVKLVVTGTLTLNGTINADAGTVSNNGGSGGSVWIDAGTFQGSGSITSSGLGNDRPGGGGRIAIYYTTSSYTGIVDSRGSFSDTWSYQPQPGTLWEPKRYDNLQGTASIPSDVVISNSFQYYFADERTNYWNLTINNSARVYFHDSIINVSNLTVIGKIGTSENDISVLRGDVNSLSLANQYDCVDFNIGGNIVLTNNAEVHFSDATLTSESISVTESSTFETMVGTTMPTTWNNGNLGLGDDSIIYLVPQTYTFNAFYIPASSTVFVLGDPTAINADAGGTAGTPYGIGSTIQCQSASIDGEINGVGLGFPSFEGPGAYYTQYYGAAHGGNGIGKSTVPYGNLTRPTELGSGGSWSKGGSAVKIVAAGEIALNGSIILVGEPNGNNRGSAGSIWLVCDGLTGTGTLDLSADGRDRPPGGGRVAIEYTTSSYSGDISVEGKIGRYGTSGTGTVYMCQTPVPGGDGGIILDSAYTADDNSVKIVRTVSQWREEGKVIEWTDISTTVDGTPLANVATYTLTGVDTALAYKVFEDDVKIDTWSQVGDTITIPDITVSHTILVSALQAGSLFIVQ